MSFFNEVVLNSSMFSIFILLSDISNSFIILIQFSYEGQERVVVGTLDLNQCMKLPDEISGKKPEVFLFCSIALLACQLFMS